VPDNEPWGLWVGKGGDTLGYELTECMAVIRQGHPPAGPGPLHSEFAIVSNELRNLKAEFNQLSRQHQRVSNDNKPSFSSEVGPWTGGPDH
jgi:hypothetical protein